MRHARTCLAMNDACRSRRFAPTTRASLRALAPSVPAGRSDALKGALLGRNHRQPETKARLELAIDAHARAAQASGRLSRRDRAGLGYRRGGDGALVAARPARRRCARLGGVQPGLGHRHHRAAQAQGRARAARALRRAARSLPSRFRPRRGVRLERHDLGRARAERRLDRAPTARASPSATRPRPSSRKRSIGRSSMPRPSPGRRCWAARRSTAC